MNRASTSSVCRILVVTCTVAGFVLIGVGVYGMVTGSPRTTSTRTETPRASDPGSENVPESLPTQQPDEVPTLPSAPRSADPERFARAIAKALFAWDTTSGFMPLDYASVLLGVGDPSGAEQAGLAADLAAYLPSRAAWLDLREYATRQRLTISRAFIPAEWASAVAQARPGQLADGTVAYTIEGVRRRSGVWNDEPATSTHVVAFTLFIVCAPTYEFCRLLRLSQLDNPLR